VSVELPSSNVALDDEKYLLRAIELSRSAREHGNTPFGSLLVDAHGEIVLEQENVEVTERDCTGHAETALMRNASKRFDPEFLAACTLYTSCEPCAMCAVAIYWGHVNRVVYGMDAEDLATLIGESRDNPPLELPCREVFARTAKPIEVVGPVEAVRDAARKAHADFW
jgi:tRNA(Arg) A34 adenosine deaminase TadA